MKPLKEYTIPFVGLKIGVHQFDYIIDNSFFEHLAYEEFNSASVKVDLAFEKKSTLMELNFKAQGTVNVNCDVTNEPFDLAVQNELFLVIKFGAEFNDENEELLILPHGDYQVNVQQYIYELIVLGVPLKRVHPGVEDGSLDSDILDKLEELHPGGRDNKKDRQEKETDPRWDQLKNLLND
ncbi:DUF177 domain-containing protein [Aquimarina sp. ERC-38]|uniref:YceD family protein n=1 Tax=Aquimarina sp. ERC-38 TaxID=2949996 RepID=UPI002245AE0E|nr:DUF177 domain-containing protein [Aquimarina sp. ERC-38]UZO81677.1 DUF177 domain-containing protein [Aquimarina sp. ERC-38]